MNPASASSDSVFAFWDSMRWYIEQELAYAIIADTNKMERVALRKFALHQCVTSSATSKKP